MRFDILSIFPEMIADALQYGVIGQAIHSGIACVKAHNLRDFAEGVHQSVDDRPYGGGDGMVMTAEPLIKGLRQHQQVGQKIVLLSAHGEKWSDQKARQWSSHQGSYMLICGRYGGVDQRFIESYVDEEISIGDYILSGGELAAMVIVDSVLRHMPNVLGSVHSSQMDSFSDGLLEAPQFTRPREVQGLPVPETLLSGDHKKIQELRRALSLAISLQKRPDLVTASNLESLSEMRPLLNALTPLELKACGIDPSILKDI